MKVQFTITELRLMRFLLERYQPNPISAKNDKEEKLYEAADGLHEKLCFMVEDESE
jgi:hypothetical protein